MCNSHKQTHNSEDDFITRPTNKQAKPIEKDDPDLPKEASLASSSVKKNHEGANS